jgi:DNA-binding transcriptional MerR regulator
MAATILSCYLPFEGGNCTLPPQVDLRSSDEAPGHHRGGTALRRAGVDAAILRGERLFDGRVLERLAFIALGRASGFALDELAHMFAADGKPRIDRKVLAAKAEELDRTIRELTAMRDGLRHAVACRAPSHMECPTFQRLLRAAASGTIGARKKKALS